jgi:hypothetical protein
MDVVRGEAHQDVLRGVDRVVTSEYRLRRANLTRFLRDLLLFLVRRDNAELTEDLR